MEIHKALARTAIAAALAVHIFRIRIDILGAIPGSRGNRQRRGGRPLGRGPAHLQGHSLCRAAAWHPPLARAASPGFLAWRPPRLRVRARLPASRQQGHPARRYERGLPHAQRLVARKARRRQAAGDGLAPWRRVREWLHAHGDLRWGEHRPARRGHRLDELPPRFPGLFRPPRA